MNDSLRRFLPVLHHAALPGIIAAGSLYFTLQHEIAAALRYDRAAIMAGEWWRILSGHLVHGGLAHWALNMLGFALILAIFPGRISWRGLAVLMPLALAVGGGLFFLSPEVVRYVGLSGVLHGLFAVHVLREMLAGNRIYGFALALLAAKIILEQIADPLGDAQTIAGLPVIVDAHFYGAAAGLGLALILHGLLKRRRETVRP